MQKPSAPVYPHVSTVNLAGLSTTPPLSPGPNTLMPLVHSDDNVDLKRRPQDLGADEGHHDDVPPHLDRRVGVLRGVVVLGRDSTLSKWIYHVILKKSQSSKLTKID